jgi:hypothetical protein
LGDVAIHGAPALSASIASSARRLPS